MKRGLFELKRHRHIRCDVDRCRADRLSVIRVREQRDRIFMSGIIREFTVEFRKLNADGNDDLILLVQGQNRLRRSKDINVCFKEVCTANGVGRFVLGNVDRLKIAEAVFKQCDRVFKLIRRLLLENHTDETHAVPLCTGYQCLPRAVRITGFRTDQIFIHIAVTLTVSGDQPVMCRHDDLVRLFFGRVERIIGCARHLAEQLGGKEGACDLGKIVGAGVMCIVGKPARIHEMRIHTAKLCRAFVHHIRECAHRAGNMLPDGVCDLVGAGDQNGIERLFH